MNQNRRYLLTGAGGFLGKIINITLKKQGIDVMGLDLAEQMFNIDITRPFFLENNLAVDVVVHAAGKAHSIPKNREEEKAFYDVNFEGTKNLCNALDGLSVKPKAFIFISTVAVYGVDSGSMIGESHQLNGETPYAKSKIFAEEWLKKWAQNRDIKLGVMRLPLIAGPNPPGNLGAMIKAIDSGRYLSIGKALARKSIVWQEDIPMIIPALAEIGGTYNLTDGYHPSFKELEEVISKARGKKKPISIPILIARILGRIGDFAGDKSPVNSDKIEKITSNLTFDDRRARNILNWKPSSVLNKLAETL